MSNKHIKDAIDSRLCGVRYDTQKALQAAYRAKKPTLKVIPFKRIISVAAACCVMLTCSVEALASPSLSWLVSLLGQNIMDMVQPVVQQCDSSDVRMEVLAAMNDELMKRTGPVFVAATWPSAKISPLAIVIPVRSTPSILKASAVTSG